MKRGGRNEQLIPSHRAGSNPMGLSEYKPLTCRSLVGWARRGSAVAELMQSWRFSSIRIVVDSSSRTDGTVETVEPRPRNRGIGIVRDACSRSHRHNLAVVTISNLDDSNQKLRACDRTAFWFMRCQLLRRTQNSPPLRPHRLLVIWGQLLRRNQNSPRLRPHRLLSNLYRTVPREWDSWSPNYLRAPCSSPPNRFGCSRGERVGVATVSEPMVDRSGHPLHSASGDRFSSQLGPLRRR